MTKNKTLLTTVNLEGEEYHLKFNDGSKWFVASRDLPTVATWLPEENIEVKNLKDRSMFPYKLVNQDKGISVQATKLY